MKILLLRHGATAGNGLGRYIGRTDEPLSPAGTAEVQAAGGSAALSEVYVTPLLRTRQTAEILFPNAKQIVADGLQEMDFGDFEGKSASEMANDPEYRKWVDGGCLGTCPGGESKDIFTKRVRKTFESIILSRMATTASEKGRDADIYEIDSGTAVFVVHGGTIMAILEAYARPAMSFYEGHTGNAKGFLCRLSSPEKAPGKEKLPFMLTDIARVDRICL